MPGAIIQMPNRAIPSARGIAPSRPAVPVAPQQAQAPSLPQIQMQAPQIQVPANVEAPQVQAPPIGGGAPGSPSPGGVPGAPGNAHVAMANPEMQEYLARIRKRLDTPGDDTRALNQAGQAVNQFAAGQRNNASASALQRGTFGIGGAEGQISDDIGNVAQGNFAKAAENIALQRMRDNDQALFAAQGAFSEPGRMNLADRGLGIQAQGQQNQLDLSRADMELRARMSNQQAAGQVASQNLQAQLQAQALAAQQQQAMLTFYANLYR